MELPLDQLNGARMMEPSPSPPVTARGLVPPSHIHSKHQPSQSESVEEDVSPSSQRRTPSPLNSNRLIMRRIDRRLRAPAAQASHTSEVVEECASQPRRSGTSTSTRPSGPLDVRPLNVAPVHRPKRRSASLFSIPSPNFEWDAPASEQRCVDNGGSRSVPHEGEEKPTSSSRHARQNKKGQQRPQRRSSGDSTSTSAARRSNVIGPDPRDCIDQQEGDCEEEEEEPQEMRVVPLPHELYQRPLQQRQQRAPVPAPGVMDNDLAALMQADALKRCCSDSRREIFLVESDAAAVEEISSQDSHCAFSIVDPSTHHTTNTTTPVTTRCVKIRTPSELTGKGEEEVNVEGEDGNESVASSSSRPSAYYPDCVFAQDYYYYPTTSNPETAAEEAVMTGEQEDIKTPARHGGGDDNSELRAPRRTSASPSSSLPRWAHLLAEETPFTPFTFTSQCPAAAPVSCTPSPAVVPNTPDTEMDGVPASSSAAAADCRRVSILDGLSAGAPQRLTVQEVVAAVLATPPTSTVMLREAELEKEEIHFDGPLDEPAPRRPTERDPVYNILRASSSSQQLQQSEQLVHRIANVRARLSHVDQLVARFDAVIEARQTELNALKEKHQEVAQQTESHKARAAMARKEARRLRDRQHTQEELQLLRDMLVDKENGLSVAQSQLVSLKRLRQQLDLLHTASAEKPSMVSERRRSGPAMSVSFTKDAKQSEATDDRALPTVVSTQGDAQPLLPPSPPPSEARGALLPLSFPPPTTKALSSPPAAVAVANNSSAELKETEPSSSASEQQEAQRSASCDSSASASSLASLNTCDIMDDFLEELLMEVDGLSKVCIQLPSPPPAVSYCSRISRSNQCTNTNSMKGSNNNTYPGPSRRARPTYSALNRRLNDGNNGFFSFFGGATEAHLNSKPLSTFLASLDRLARFSWELEEEVQLRAREMATEVEEEELRARLMLKYGLADKSDTVNHADGDSESHEAVPQASQSSCTEEVKEALHLLEGGDPLLATASSERTTRQLFLSSPEHGRRSRGNVGSGGRNSSSSNYNGGLLSPSGCSTPSSTSPLLRRPVSVSLLLPTLVYAYPRVCAVSQHLDDEQQQIQRDYAAAIAAARHGRRAFTSRLREVYKGHVVPILREKIATLMQQQVSLARELGELGVKEVTLEWEEEESDMPDDAALWQLMDEATAVGRRQWLGPRRRGGHNRSPSRFTANSAGREEDGSLDDDDASSRGVSMMRGEGEGSRRERMRKAASLSRLVGAPACQVYRRTLHVVCGARTEEGKEDVCEVAARRGTTPASARSERCNGLSQPQQQHSHRHHRRHMHGSADETRGCDSARPRSARLARCRSSAESGRRSTATSVRAPRPSESSVPPPLSDQDTKANAAIASSSSKTCAALQLYTHSPSQQLLQLVHRRKNHHHLNKHNNSSSIATWRCAGLTGAAEEKEEAATAVTRGKGSNSVNSRLSHVAPIDTSSMRCSGGTPRVSGAVGSSVTTRSSTATTSARMSAMAPPSPRHRRNSSQPVPTFLPTTAVAAAASATAPAPAPLIHDSRVRLSTGIGTPQCGSAVRPATTTATAAAAGLWSPFTPVRDALAEGAVHVQITFTGVEAHRRQVAQERREAYQREFWQLREELARIDEDIFQLRAKHTELCALQQRTEVAQEEKLAEAEAKVKKSRAFYKALKRENKEWQDICDELQRVIQEGE